MNIAFSICDNNYLDKANVLYSSLKQHNQDYTTYLFLVDEVIENILYDEIDIDFVIPISQLNIDSFSDLILKYDIVELSTAVKVFAFEYLFQNHGSDSSIFYFDPDIKIYNSLKSIVECFSKANILLTPHVVNPISLNASPFENTFLNYGIYNLGFIGLKNYIEIKDFLKWWKERMLKYCIIDVKNGFFVDQLFFNLVPLYFESVYILSNNGLNVAYWNIEERKVELINSQWFVNKISPLIFFHFSSFDTSLESLTRRSCSVSINSNKELKMLFEEYNNDIKKNYKLNSKYENYYSIARNEKLKNDYDKYINSSYKVLFIYYLIKVTPSFLIRKILNFVDIIQRIQKSSN